MSWLGEAAGGSRELSDTLSVPMKAPCGSILWILALCMLLVSCAQTGPPLPPSLELPKAPSDLRASRKGDRVTLVWSEPTRTTDRQSIRYLGPTRVCRTLESEMKECGSPVGLVPPPPGSQIASSAQPNEKTYVDSLPAEIQIHNPTAEAIYAVEVFNRDGRSAGLSNQVRIPSAPTLPAPADLQAHLGGDGVALEWTSAGETPGAVNLQHRYRIYRRDEATGKDAIAGENPAGTAGPTRFLDSNFEWEKTYSYRIAPVTIVARPPSAEVEVEGDDSPAVRVIAHDVFPPAVPSGLQAVYSGEGQKPFVDLIWAPVTNTDLAGYNIYRREPNGTRQKLNSDLVKAPSYRDSAVVSGTAYVYSVSSVDRRGNESAVSEEATEQVP